MYRGAKGSLWNLNHGNAKVRPPVVQRVAVRQPPHCYWCGRWGHHGHRVAGRATCRDCVVRPVGELREFRAQWVRS